MDRESLRFRVAVFAMASAAVTLVLFSACWITWTRIEVADEVADDIDAIAALLLRDAQEGRLDLSLLQTRFRMGEAYADLQGDEAEDDEASILLARVRNAAGEVLFSDPRIPPRTWSAGPHPHSRMLQVPIGEEREWELRRFQKNGWQVDLLVESQLSRAAFLESLPPAFSLVVLGMMLAALFGWLVARFATERLDALTKAVNRLPGEPRSHRLPADSRRDEIGQLTSGINQLLERLETSFQDARQFSADASHELRTPLAILQGELEASLRSGGGPEEREARALRMLGETRRLTALTRMLLYLARSDAGMETPERQFCDLRKVVEAVLEDVSASEGFPIERWQSQWPSEPVRVCIDPALWAHAAFNLLQNALRHGDPEGPHSLVLTATPEVIALRIGNAASTPETDANRLFQRFVRGGGRERSDQRDGFGLGLNLARRIARDHGGDVEIESWSGGHVVFRLTLPPAPGKS